MYVSPHPKPEELLTPRPEQTFFEDPAIDRALAIVMALATEVYVLRDRVFAMERQLAANGTLDIEALDAEPGAEERSALAADREAFVTHIMHSAIGLQFSKGAKA